MLVASNILQHLDEWREVDALLLGNTLGLQDHEVIHGFVEEVYLEILTLPDERATRLANGGTIGVCLLQERLVEGVANLTLGLQIFCSRHALLGLVDIDHFPTPAATAQAHLYTWVGHQIGLRNLALDALRQLAREFDEIDALFLDGLCWKSP